MAGSIKIGPPAVQPSQVFFISNFCLRNPSQVLKYRVNQKLPAFPLPGAPFFLPTPVMNETQVIMKIFIIVGKFIHISGATSTSHGHDCEVISITKFCTAHHSARWCFSLPHPCCLKFITFKFTFPLFCRLFCILSLWMCSHVLTQKLLKSQS